MLVNSNEILNQADLSQYAIPSPDFFNQNSLKAYIEVAEEFNKPIIIAYSGNMKINFFTLEEAAYIGRYYAQKANVPVCLHLDHGYKLDFIKKAIDLGFSSVMIDASAEPFEINVNKTKEILEYAKGRDISVEAEIGHVGSGINYENEKENDSVFTQVEECIKFVEQTGINSVAVSIGTAHGVYSSGSANINFERLKELKEAINIPLVLHGGSSSGDENLKKCAQLGISKINLFTDMVNGSYSAAKKSDAKNFMELMSDSDEGMKNVLRHYYNLFGI